MKTAVLCLLLFAALAQASSTANLPLDHWAYPFLERLEAKGVISGYELRVRPLPRAAVADLVLQALTNAAQKPKRLTASDRRLLEQLASDLCDELSGHPLMTALPPEPHFYSHREADAVFHFDLTAQQAILSNRRTDSSELLSETTLGGQLRGSLSRSVAFFAEVRNTLTRGEERDLDQENYDPSHGEPITTSGENVYRDRATAYFVYDKSRIRLEAGKDEFDWGPFYGQGAALSLSAPPAELLRFAVRTQPFKFTYMHAWLRSPLGPKYLAAHRLDVKPMSGLYLGLAETVVYAGRDVELAYLNPLMLYHVAEHHLGDRDNNNLSVDAVFTRIPTVTLSAEWYIDDMTSTQSWRNYFGNKFAWSVGGLWADALMLPDLDLRLRYTKISPFVYSHWDSSNIYTHYDKIIGNPLGPNADEWSFQLGRQFGRDFRLELFHRRIRKGAGAADTVTRPITGDRKDFLAGTVERRALTGFRLVDQVRRDLFVSLDYAYEDVRNRALTDAADHGHVVRLQIDWNY